MMNEAIIVAVLGCIGTVVGSGIGAIAASGKTNFRLEQLEKKMDKTTELVERLVMVEERSKNNSHRLEELERNEYAYGGRETAPSFLCCKTGPDRRQGPYYNEETYHN